MYFERRRVRGVFVAVFVAKVVVYSMRCDYPNIAKRLKNAIFDMTIVFIQQSRGITSLIKLLIHCDTFPLPLLIANQH
jgi:hypothetical protein